MCVPCTLWVALGCVYHLRVGAICHVQYAIVVAGKLPADRGAPSRDVLESFHRFRHGSCDDSRRAFESESCALSPYTMAYVRPQLEV